MAVIRRMGNSKPLFLNAALTRSRASWTAGSGSPTMLNFGRPGEMSTSTRTIYPSKAHHGAGLCSCQHNWVNLRRAKSWDALRNFLIWNLRSNPAQLYSNLFGCATGQRQSFDCGALHRVLTGLNPTIPAGSGFNAKDAEGAEDAGFLGVMGR